MAVSAADESRGNVGNPYIGLLVFIAIPIVFFAGLALIPIGIMLWRSAGSRRRSRLCRIASRLSPRRHFLRGDDRRERGHRKPVQLSRRGAHGHPQFCGQSCHVMKPEFTAHISSHRIKAVACASCHIAPGATGWLHAKMAGTRQLFAVVFNTFPRPIESAMENNRLVSSADTCEQCHARERVIGPRLRVITKYKDDEANTRTETVLMMMVGGGATGGIHGAHMGPGVHIRYAAADKKRQTIPWVEYQNATAEQANLSRKRHKARCYCRAADVRDAVRGLPQSRRALLRTAGPRSGCRAGIGRDRDRAAVRQEDRRSTLLKARL